MSKSLGNTIALREPDSAVWDKLRTAATDPARVRRTDPGDPEKCNIYTLHRFFSDDERAGRGAHRLHDRGHRLHRLQEVAARGGEGRPGSHPRPARTRCGPTPPASTGSWPTGAARARTAARETLNRVRERLGFASAGP